METTDLLVAGAGPAGLAASLYARRQGVDVTVLEMESPGGQLLLAPEIQNYPGVSSLPGYELADTMAAQARELGARLMTGQLVGVRRASPADSGLFDCALSDGGAIRAKVLVIATGAHARKAGFENEPQLTGHGVSYCATCDGPFFRDKHVFVIGGGDSAAAEALHLANVASGVTMLVRRDRLAASASYQAALDSRPNVEVVRRHVLKGVYGSDRVRAIEVCDLDTGAIRRVDFGDEGCGVFVAVGREPATEPFRGLGILDERGYVMTDDTMATQCAGVFAAGDVRAKPLRQVVTACSDGAVAAESACEFLRSSMSFQDA